MKSTMICMALALSLLLSSCKQSRMAVSVILMQDLTDSMASLPDTARILGCFSGLREDRYQGAEFSAVPITDIALNRAACVRLEPASELLTNPKDRMSLVRSYEANVAAAVAGLTLQPVGRPRSSIFLAVARQAAHLSLSAADRKMLVVYSDLRENGSIDLHSKAGVGRLKSHRGEVLEELRSGMPDADLSGVEIYLIYEARSYEDSEAFAQIAGAYRELFERKGAKVFVDASFNP